MQDPEGGVPVGFPGLALLEIEHQVDFLIDVVYSSLACSGNHYLGPAKRAGPPVCQPFGQAVRSEDVAPVARQADGLLERAAVGGLIFVRLNANRAG